MSLFRTLCSVTFKTFKRKSDELFFGISGVFLSEIKTIKENVKKGAESAEVELGFILKTGSCTVPSVVRLRALWYSEPDLRGVWFVGV